MIARILRTIGRATASSRCSNPGELPLGAASHAEGHAYRSGAEHGRENAPERANRAGTGDREGAMLLRSAGTLSRTEIQTPSECPGPRTLTFGVLGCPTFIMPSASRCISPPET